MYKSVEMVHVVRTSAIEFGGLYIATSADVPSMYGAAFDLVSLRDAIEESIHRYFYEFDDRVEVQLSGRKSRQSFNLARCPRRHRLGRNGRMTE